MDRQRVRAVHPATRSSSGSTTTSCRPTWWCSSARPGGCCGSRSRPSGRRPTPIPGEPLLVCCRHAGPGDSFIADVRADALVRPRAARRAQGHPRLGPGDRHDAAPAAEPVHLGPTPAPGEDVEAQIGDLARNLDENDAFVIFPEGGNFTPERRERAIDRLRGSGMERMAERAERMKQRARPAAGRRARRAGRRARGRRAAGRAHRPRPRAHDPRRLALAADGQAAADGLVAGARARRSPRAARTGSSGSSTGGSGSTTGSTSTGPADLPPKRMTTRRTPRCDGPSGPSQAVRTSSGSSTSADVDLLDRGVRRGDRVRLLGGVGERLARVGPGRVAGTRSTGCRPRRRRRGCRPSAPGARRGGRSGRRRLGRTTTASWLLVAALQLLEHERAQAGERREQEALLLPTLLRRVDLALDGGGGRAAAALGLLGDRPRPVSLAAATAGCTAGTTSLTNLLAGVGDVRRGLVAARRRSVGARSGRAASAIWEPGCRGRRRAGASWSLAFSTWGAIASARSCESWACSTNFSLRLLANMVADSSLCRVLSRLPDHARPAQVNKPVSAWSVGTPAAGRAPAAWPSWEDRADVLTRTTPEG